MRPPISLSSTALQRRNVAAHGVRLHVVEAGPPDGDPVLLLHGFPEFWYGWRHQIPALADAGHRVIVPDQRGYNRSDKPADVGAYALRHLVADALALIDRTGHARVDVVGHDWGAAVAWALAAWYPERVRRLGILNVPHPRVMRETLRTDPWQMLRSWYALFFQIPELPERLLAFNDGMLLAALMRWSGHADTFSDEDLAAYRAAWREPGALRGMLHWYRAALRHDAMRRVPDAPIAPPTLVVWGAQDVALRLHMAQPSIERCRDGRLAVIDDATHWVQHDAAGRVNALLTGFLSGQRSGSTPAASSEPRDA